MSIFNKSSFSHLLNCYIVVLFVFKKSTKPEPTYFIHNKFFFFSFLIFSFKKKTIAFYFLPTEAKSLARTIHKFKYDIGNKKTSYINLILQELVNRVAAIESINPPFLDVSKKHKSSSICFLSFLQLFLAYRHR